MSTDIAADITGVPAVVPRPIYVADMGRHLGTAVDPQPRDVILCTYPDTLDGWLAAWVVRGIAKTHALHVEFQLDTAPLPNLADRNWIVVGHKTPEIDSGSGPRTILSLEHGPRVLVSPALPFEKWERSIPFGVKRLVAGTASGTFADPGSLAGAAWAFFGGARKGFEARPRLIDYLEDEKHALNGRTALIACVESYPRDFATLDRLVEATDDRKRREMMFVAGQAILRYVAQQEATKVA